MANVTEYFNVSRKLTIDLLELYGIDRERGYRVTQIADEFDLKAEPVLRGLIRVIANGDGNYTIQDHTD